LKTRQKIVVIKKDEVVHLILQRPIRETRGFVKEVTTHQLRDEENRY